MAVITANVFVRNGRLEEPVVRAFVEHVGPLGLGSLGVTLTDDNGAFTFDAGLLANEIDFRVHCQNSVIRVLDGGRFNIAVSVGGRCQHGTRFIIPNAHTDHFRILNQCVDIYDTVWRQFAPYSNRSRRSFPLGRRTTLRQTLASSRRIELSYPDNMISQLAFVEPAGLSNESYPLVHIKDRISDPRLFGETDASGDLRDQSLLPHELGHVFHFAAMQQNTRVQVEGTYIGYLLSRIPAAVAAGNTDPFTHDVNVKTAPAIALIEAIGIFSERMFAFAKRVRPELSGRRLHEAFVEDQLAVSPALAGILRDNHEQVATRNARGGIDPLLTGNDFEGAVYGAIFLELASRLGMRVVVEALLASNATNFDEFATYLDSTQQVGRAVLLTRANWNL